MTSELPHSFDAQVWAKEFVETIKNNPNISIDEDLMRTWFANALMAGYNEAWKRVPVVKLATNDWTNGEIVQIVKELENKCFIVKFLNPLLVTSVSQSAAKQMGYPEGHVLVESHEILRGVFSN